MSRKININYSFIALVVLFLIGFYLRIKNIYGSLNFDEGQFITISWLLSKGKILYSEVFTNKPPGIYLLFLPLHSIVTDKVTLIVIARIISILFALIAIFPLYHIASSVNKRFALLLPIIFIIENYNFHWQRYVMTEQFVVTLSLLSVCFLISYLKTKSKNKNKLFLSILFSFISILIKQTGLISMAVIIISMLIIKKKQAFKDLLYIFKILFIFTLIFYFVFLKRIPYNDLYSGVILTNLGGNGGVLELISNRFSEIYRYYLYDHSWIILSILGIFGLVNPRFKSDIIYQILVIWFLIDTVFLITVPQIHYGYSGFSHYWLQYVPSSLLLAYVSISSYLKFITNKIVLVVIGLFIIILLFLQLKRIIAFDLKTYRVDYPGGKLEDELNLTNTFLRPNMKEGGVIMQFFTNYYYYLDIFPSSKFIEFGPIYLELGNYYINRYTADLLNPDVKYLVIPEYFYKNLETLEGKVISTVIKNNYDISTDTLTKYDSGMLKLLILTKNYVKP